MCRHEPLAELTQFVAQLRRFEHLEPHFAPGEVAGDPVEVATDVDHGVAPVRGAAPLFPADNWWNLDIRSAPVDANSAAYIAFINNGGTRRLHPDFGGTESTGSVPIYGMPYAQWKAQHQK